MQSYYYGVTKVMRVDEDGDVQGAFNIPDGAVVAEIYDIDGLVFVRWYKAY